MTPKPNAPADVQELRRLAAMFINLMPDEDRIEAALNAAADRIEEIEAQLSAVTRERDILAEALSGATECECSLRPSAVTREEP